MEDNKGGFKSLLKNWLMPISFIVCLLSTLLSFYTTPDIEAVKTPTKMAGVAILELFGVSSWGGMLSFLIMPSLIMLIASLGLWILIYPKDFFLTVKNGIVDWIKEVREQPKE